MEEEIQIPELTIHRCSICGSHQIAEREAQVLCQPCVNQFLARNVGVMQPDPPVKAVTNNGIPDQEVPAGHSGGFAPLER